MQTLSHLTITCNSLGAGQFKSTDCRKKIKHLIDIGKKAILIVPSLVLQEEYRTKLYEEDVDPSDFVIINNKNKFNTVGKEFIQRIFDTKIICITHEAFKMIDHHSLPKSIISEFRLIFDEAPVPYWTETISQNKKDPTKFSPLKDDLRQYFKNIETSDKFVQIHIPKSGMESFLFDKTMIRKIENPSFIKYVSETNYQSLIDNTAKEINLFGLFDFNILSLYRHTYVYSAAFHTTPFGIILANRNANIVYEHEFVKHDKPITFHIGSMNEHEIYNHSKSKQKDYPERLDKFHEYTSASIGDSSYIVLRNVSDDSDLDGNSELITHNCHGINNHRDKSHFVFESALNPSHHMDSFLKNKLKFSDDQVTFSMSANTLYQSLMRLSIRNSDYLGMTNVYSMDAKSANLVANTYFTNSKKVFIQLGIIRIQSIDETILSFIKTIQEGKYKSSELYDMYTNFALQDIQSINMFGKSLSMCEWISKTHTNKGSVYVVGGIK